MAAAGKDGAGDLPVERGEESERAFLERKDRVTTAELDAMGGSDVVDGGRIDAQSVDRIIQFMRRSLRGRDDRRRQKTPQREELRPCPHIQSVVTFGMGEQGRAAASADPELRW